MSYGINHQVGVKASPEPVHYRRSKVESRNDSGSGSAHSRITPWQSATRALDLRSALATRSSDIDPARTRIASCTALRPILSAASAHRD
jgi:hypothetical protein